ncbi:TPA: tail fiber assembly protein [Salmonella enterica]|nr:hypothetical protein [Salmonella enterica subsp. enterica serovar Kentucky]HAF1675174.1 tail fiber assembly protein [Salmonella enterica]
MKRPEIDDKGSGRVQVPASYFISTQFVGAVLTPKDGPIGDITVKAAIGRLKGGLAQYNLWLDYLDALEAVNTSSAPDINWPDPPEVQAI